MKVNELVKKYGVSADAIRKWIKLNKLSIQPNWRKG